MSGVMKALLSILPITLLMVGCENPGSKPDLTNTAPEKDPMESAVEWSKLQNRNGDAYIPNTDKPYSGWAKQVYDNEQVKVLAEFTDGSVTRLRQWQENGIPMWDIRCLKGKVILSDVPLEGYWDLNDSLRHGLRTLWHKNGQMFQEGNYKDGKQDGLHTRWHENGQKSFEGNYKDGKQDGLHTLWYENGQKSFEGNYKDGQWDGLHTLWYENGQMGDERNYKDGKLVTATAWKQNGEKCPITNVVNGNSEIVSYNEDGTVSDRDTYKDGKLVEVVRYNKDGTVRARFTYKDGILVQY